MPPLVLTHSQEDWKQPEPTSPPICHYFYQTEAHPRTLPQLEVPTLHDLACCRWTPLQTNLEPTPHFVWGGPQEGLELFFFGRGGTLFLSSKSIWGRRAGASENHRSNPSPRRRKHRVWHHMQSLWDFNNKCTAHPTYQLAGFPPGALFAVPSAVKRISYQELLW